VFHRDRVYVTAGGDLWWGKKEAWLKCIDATQRGDITESGEIWSYPLGLHSCSTPAVSGGLVFVGDSGKKLHCVDAATGQPCWTHDLDRDVWGSALVADGKVHVGTRGGGFWVFEAAREKRLLAFTELGAPISSTPVAANGVLYVSTMKRLYATEAPGAKAR